MPHVVTLHLHNVVPAAASSYAQWFDGPHREGVRRLGGFMRANRYALATAQVMPDIAQPWQFVSVYEFEHEDPAAAIPQLGPHLLEAREQGWIDDEGESERVLSYVMYSDWRYSCNYDEDEEFSGISVLLGNFSPGMEQAYHRWYDDVHAPEVTRTPGKVAMKRGKLASTQIEPRRFTYGGELVLCAQQTDDLALTVRDFSARARGCSPSGVAFEPRSIAGSFARTVHYFTKTSGRRFWPGGIAYDGDMSVYAQAAVD